MTAVGAPAAIAPGPATASGAPTVGPPPVGRREAVLLAIGAVALGVAVIGTRWGVFTPDTRPDLYQDPGRFLHSTIQAWVGGVSGLGQGNFNAGAAPVAAVVWLIRALGAPPWLAVRLWRLAVMLVGAWGIRRYLGALLGRRLSVAGRVLGTVFWVINPYAVVAGSTTPILLPYALLPWTMLAFLHATRSPRSWRWPALFGLAFFAQSGLNAGVVPFFQLLALPAHLAHARWVEGRRWRDLLRVLLRSGLCAAAVSLYWLLPSFLAAGTGAGIATGTENPIDVARTSSYAETSRLLGNWPLYGRAGDRAFLGDYTVYLTNPFVVLASFLVPVAAGLALWLSRARERLLVVVLLAVGLPVMVGMFPPEDPYPAGRALRAVFDHVPAALAFRTTNKVGAVVVLAETIALVVGWRSWQGRARGARRPLRWAGGLAAALVLLGAAAPVWTGGLYPLGYTIPASWRQATAALDEVRPASRVLVLPGGTGGNYRWGMRSPDDLFPSLLERPVAVRNTVVGRGDPAGNLLSAFDLVVAQGGAGPTTISTAARYLGAGDLLVRNDLLTEEIGGPTPSVVVGQVRRDQGLTATGAYGTAGTDTVPGSSGPATKADRRRDPRDAALRPLLTYRVADPQPVTALEPVDRQVLVAGDAEALAPLAAAGLVDGRNPIRLLGDLDASQFAAALRDGGRIVLTDTNRRRAWDGNRTANATSPTLTADADIDAGDSATTTRWPDRPNDQTVSVLEGGATVGADRPGFGLHPYGRPSNAFDGDPNTAWVTGGFGTAAGDSIWIDLPRRRRIRSITITPSDSRPSSIVAVRVEVGDRSVIEAAPPGGGPISVGMQPTTADRVEVTILEQTPGDNPVGISEIDIDGTTVHEVARLPKTLDRLVAEADGTTRARLAALPLDVLLTRQRGAIADPVDDEEAQLDRDISLPATRSFRFEAQLAVPGAAADAVQAAREGDRPCLTVAVLDGRAVQARITSSRSELADGTVRLAGCAPVRLSAGTHRLRTIFGWRLDSVRLSSPGRAARAVDPGSIRVLDRSATEVHLRVSSGTGARYLRLGEAFDDRWTLSVDGRDAGRPVVIDTYSSGWRLDPGAHDLVARFAPQRAVQGTFVASAGALVGVTALAVLPPPDAIRRRRPLAPQGAEPAGAAP